ncbi:hypothetical protein H072_3827 [Dactylellina haptotyla CBS 200.50]|uniref:Major facilitator superfamily (MFS) profile domain-containing protein n=1 Tax=Dactylellina haptotyla (strain CBS 200.50) TaxID=1284197 RepID=S8AGB1_DACHA|nr:hypothetical protein H072_3827 [Dactylellina haptotyla CBS 200.50]
MATSPLTEATPLLSSSPQDPHPPTGLLHDESTPLIDPNGKPADEENVLAEEGNTLPDMPNVRLAAIIPPLMIGVFLSAMDTLIVASAYGRIGSDLHELSKTSWIAAAYLVTTTSFQPLYGKLSDIFGRKSCLLFSYTIFAIGSLWCGLARSMDELILARGFAGIGGGGMTTLVSILMSDVIPLHKRGTWQGIINLVYASGAAAGAPLGGYLADTVGWRWAFLFQAPASVLAAILVTIFLNVPHNHPDANESSTWRKFKRVDFMGAVTLVLAVLSFLVALDRGGNVSWNDKVVFITAPLSIVLFITFLIIEELVAVDPFAPLSIIFEKGLLACFLCNLFSFAGFYAAMFYVPLYFQAAAGLTASQSGFKMVPAIAGSVSGSLGGGLIMQKTGKYYHLTILAYTFMVIGAVPVILCTGLLGKSFLGIEIGLAIMGLGNGIGVTSTLVALIARAGGRDQAVATAVSYLFRSLGSVVGVSLSSTLLQGDLRSTLRTELKGMVGKDEVEEIVRNATGSLEFLKELKPNVRTLVIRAYEQAVRYPFLMALVLPALAVVSSFFIIEQPLKGKTSPGSTPSESEGEGDTPTAESS